MCTILDQLQSTVPPLLALIAAEEVILGWGKQRRGSETARGDSELKGKGVGFLSLTQSVVTSAVL